MIEVGQYNIFYARQKLIDGKWLLEHYLSGDTLTSSEPNEQLEQGQQIEAFVYHDTEDDPIATFRKPAAVVGEYAYLKCILSKDFGIFFEWGLEKDLMTPANLLKHKSQPDDWEIVRICLEEDRQRIFGSTKLGQYIEDSDFDISETDVVSIQIGNSTELGYRCIVNKKFIGMIYHNEIFMKVKEGMRLQAIVKKIRVDGLVDLALQAQGFQNLFDAKEKVLEVLLENGGKSSVTDKSSPAQIQEMFQMSKKSFKAAVGMLYRERRISLSKEEIKVI